MAETIGTAQVRIGANLDEFEKKMGRVSSRLDGMKPTFRKMAAVGTAAFAGISVGIGKTISDAGEAQKTAANFENTFGDSADVVGGFIESFGDEFKFVESELMRGANSIGFQLNAMGDIGKEEGEKITESLLTAAGGLSDFFGEEMSVADASNALAKGLAGNRQQLMDMGFNVAVEDMKEYAESLGLNANELTKAQEAQIFTQMIMDQTKGSVAGLQDSMDTYTGQQRANKKATKELSETLGTTFLPMVTDLLEKITPIIEKIGNWIEENPELAKNIGIAALAIAGLLAVVGALGLILPTLITGFGLLLSPVGLVIAIVVALIAIGVLLWKNWDTITQKAKSLWGKVTEFFSRLGESIGEIIDNIIEFFSNMWRNIKGIWGRVISFIRGIPRKIIVALASLTSTVWNFIKKYHPVAMLFRAVRNNWGGFIGWIKGIPKRIINALGNMGKLLFSTGKDMINGLISGAGSILKNIGTFLLDKIPKWIVGPFKKALGISSPSKVFMGLGEDTMAGFNVGLGEGLKDPLSSLTDSSRRFTQTFASGIEDGLKMMNQSGNQFAGAMANSTSVSTVVHGGINIGNQQQSEDFLGRLTRNRELAKMGLSMEG